MRFCVQATSSRSSGSGKFFDGFADVLIRSLGSRAGFGTVEVRKTPGAGMVYRVCLPP